MWSGLLNNLQVVSSPDVFFLHLSNVSPPLAYFYPNLNLYETTLLIALHMQTFYVAEMNGDVGTVKQGCVGIICDMQFFYYG